MQKKEKQIRMRSVFRVISPEIVWRVIEIAEARNHVRTRCDGAHATGRRAAAIAYPGSQAAPSVKDYINALDRTLQAELVGLMVLGREPIVIGVADVAAACDPEFWDRQDIGEYLSSKGGGLARYLQVGMDFIGL